MNASKNAAAFPSKPFDSSLIGYYSDENNEKNEVLDEEGFIVARESVKDTGVVVNLQVM